MLFVGKTFTLPLIFVAIGKKLNEILTIDGSVDARYIMKVVYAHCSHMENLSLTSDLRPPNITGIWQDVAAIIDHLLFYIVSRRLTQMHLVLERIVHLQL